MTKYQYIVIWISILSCIPPCMPAIKMRRNVFALYILLSALVQIAGTTLNLLGHHNIWLYQGYQIAEWALLVCYLLSLTHQNKFYSLIPVVIGACLFNSTLMVKIEMATLLILSAYTVLRLTLIDKSDMLIIAGIVFYSFDLFSFSFSWTGIELFAYLNITANIFYTMGMEEKCRKLYTLSLLLRGHVPYSTLSTGFTTGKISAMI